MRKICRRNPVPDPNWVDESATTSHGSQLEAGTHYDRASAYGMMIPSRPYALWYNLKQIFAYRPQSQDYLYGQLFEGGSEGARSARESLVYNHMRVVDELREEGEGMPFLASAGGSQTARSPSLS